jgi:hypothetical protein
VDQQQKVVMNTKEQKDPAPMKDTFSSFLKDTFSLNVNDKDLECRTFSNIDKDKGPLIVKFKNEDTLMEALQRNKTYFKENGKPATNRRQTHFFKPFFPLRTGAYLQKSKRDAH